MFVVGNYSREPHRHGARTCGGRLRNRCRASYGVPSFFGSGGLAGEAGDAVYSLGADEQYPASEVTKCSGKGCEAGERRGGKRVKTV